MAFVLNARLKLLPPRNSDVNAYIRTLNAQLKNKVNVKVNLDTKGANAQLSSISNDFRKVKTSQKKFNTGQKQSVSLMQDFADKTKLAFKRYSAFVVGTTIFLKLSRVIGDATSEAIEFRKEMIKIAQVTDSTISSLSETRKEILALSTEFGVDSVQLAKSTRLFRQAGIEAGLARGAIQTLAKTDLAPTFDDITTTTEDMIAIIRQFNIRDSKELARNFNIINKAASQYAIEAADIGVATRKAGAVFQAAGGQFDEFVTLFTAVRNQTRESADTIGTAFKTIIPRLQRSSTQSTIKELLGIDLLNESGQFKGPFEAIKRISEAIANIPDRSAVTSKLLESIGGLRQVGKTTPLLLTGADELEAILANIRDSEGSLDKDAELALKELPQIIKRAEVAFVNLFKTIENSTAFQTFAKTISVISRQVAQLANFIGQIPGAGDVITSALVSFGTFKTAQYGLGFLGALRKNSGGLIPGRGPNKDTVPAMLTKGEFVMNRQAVDNVGVDFLSSLNGYNSGGFVSRNGGSRTRERVRQFNKYGSLGDDDDYDIDTILQDNRERQAREQLKRQRRQRFLTVQALERRAAAQRISADSTAARRPPVPPVQPRVSPNPEYRPGGTRVSTNGTTSQAFSRSPNAEYRPGGTFAPRNGASSVSGLRTSRVLRDQYFGPNSGFDDPYGPFPKKRNRVIGKVKNLYRRASAPLAGVSKFAGPALAAYSLGSTGRGLAEGANQRILDGSTSTSDFTRQAVGKKVGGIASGAVAGATVGSLFGPIGTGIGALAGGLAGLASDTETARDALKFLTFGLVDYKTTSEDLADAEKKRAKEEQEYLANLQLRQKAAQLQETLNQTQLKHLDIIRNLNGVYTKFGSTLFNVEQSISGLGINLGANESLTNRALSGNLGKDFIKFSKLSQNISNITGDTEIGRNARNEATLLAALPDVVRSVVEANKKESGDATIAFSNALDNVLPSSGENLKELLIGRFQGILGTDQEGVLSALQATNAPSLIQDLSSVLGDSIEAQEFARKAVQEYGETLLKLADQKISVESQYRKSVLESINSQFGTDSKIRGFRDQDTKLTDVFLNKSSAINSLGVTGLINKDPIADLRAANLNARSRLSQLNEDVSRTGNVEGRLGEYQKLQSTIDKTSQALSVLADVSKELSVIEQQINDEQRKRLSASNYAIDLAFANTQEKQKFDINANNAKNALKNGIGSIRPQDRAGVRQYLERFSDVRLSQFGQDSQGRDRTGRQALEFLAERELGVSLQPNKKEQSLINKFKTASKIGQRADKAINEIQNNAPEISKAISDATTAFKESVQQQIPAFKNLTDAINQMPTDIEGKFEHVITVNVNLDGTKVLTDTKPYFERMARHVATDTVNDYMSENFPGSPTIFIKENRLAGL